LDTDASNVGMGSVLSQVQDGQDKVISYYNKSFNKAERKYCATRRELLPVVASIKTFIIIYMEENLKLEVIMEHLAGFSIL
jgi:hypothetical protein